MFIRYLNQKCIAGGRAVPAFAVLRLPLVTAWCETAPRRATAMRWCQAGVVWRCGGVGKQKGSLG